MTRASDSISPTAHYTGYTWFAHGLSHPALVTPQGKLMYTALRPMYCLATLTGAPTLQAFLLARHRVMDLLLQKAIEEGRVGQVIEVAAGLSPRGWRFKKRFGNRVRYIEADLPDMAERKLDLLRHAGLLTPGHDVVALDALADHGPLALSTLASSLDPNKGTAIITEGLLNYFDTPSVLGMWARFGKVLAQFPHGLYLSDIHLSDSGHRGAGVSAFKAMLSAFVKGRVHLHFENEVMATTELRNAGFELADLHQARHFAGVLDINLAPGANAVRIIEARSSKSGITG
jgi:O-methyltransferase involved in polyketide biosynthesis